MFEIRQDPHGQDEEPELEELDRGLILLVVVGSFVSGMAITCLVIWLGGMSM